MAYTLDMVYTVDMVYTIAMVFSGDKVYIVDMVYTVDTVYTVIYTAETVACMPMYILLEKVRTLLEAVDEQ